MPKLKAFQIKISGKNYDYRLGKNLNLPDIHSFFSKKYQIQNLWQDNRHVFGLFKTSQQNLFLKLSTTLGISATTQNEFSWNSEFNRLVNRSSVNFWVPQNFAQGFYHGLFYFLTDYFDGQLLAARPQKTTNLNLLKNNLSSLIDFSELIQTLPLKKLYLTPNINHQQYFLEKTISWYEAVPKIIRDKFKIADYLKIIERGVTLLEKHPRHGDFTPWHLFSLPNNKLGLIDGEHAFKNGVEYYDLAYFIQRIYSVLESPALAEDILKILQKRKYNLEKLKIILFSRAIGGFLDESLKSKPNYLFAQNFLHWIEKI